MAENGNYVSVCIIASAFVEIKSLNMHTTYSVKSWLIGFYEQMQCITVRLVEGISVVTEARDSNCQIFTLKFLKLILLAL
jgi:hypothetical protein